MWAMKRQGKDSSYLLLLIFFKLDQRLGVLRISFSPHGAHQIYIKFLYTICHVSIGHYANN